MISSIRSSSTACVAAVNGSGCAIWPCASIPSPRRIVSARRVDRVGFDHHSVRGDPGLVQRLEGAVKAPPGSGASGVLVHDIAAGGCVHRREHGDEVVAGTGSALDRVQQLLAGYGLVRDHEDVAQTFTSSSSMTRSPLKTACRAPGTPYS